MFTCTTHQKRHISLKLDLLIYISKSLSFHQLLVSLLLILTLGCTFPSSTPNVVSTIDWVDFIRFNGITYLASNTNSGNQLTQDSLGPQFAAVQFTVSENVSAMNYELKDGDAAFLPTNTPVYIVRGYRPEIRLAVISEGTLVLYEADTNPQAKRGSDLLDLAGKVESVRINSAADGITELTSITDKQQIEELVEMILQAPVDSSQSTVGEQEYLIIVFHLTDGTTVARTYFPDTGELHRGIMLPHAFADRIKTALRK